MDAQSIQVLAITFYKFASLASGTFLLYLGYRLFMASVWGNAGEAEGTFGNNKLVIKKAAPGTFFVIVGAIIIGLTVYKGLNFESLTNSGVMQGEKPVLID